MRGKVVEYTGGKCIKSQSCTQCELNTATDVAASEDIELIVPHGPLDVHALAPTHHATRTWSQFALAYCWSKCQRYKRNSIHSLHQHTLGQRKSRPRFLRCVCHGRVRRLQGEQVV